MLDWWAINGKKMNNLTNYLKKYFIIWIKIVQIILLII